MSLLHEPSKTTKEETHLSELYAKRQELAKAWREFKKSNDKRVRRALSNLPPADLKPKAIIVTRNPKPVKSDWRSWESTQRTPKSL